MRRGGVDFFFVALYINLYTDGIFVVRLKIDRYCPVYTPAVINKIFKKSRIYIFYGFCVANIQVILL